jgi:hypothetical protein
MAQSEQELRKKQAIERLIQIQAQRALDRARPQTLTTIVDGEIVRVPPPQAVFPGDGNKVGLADGPPSARARQIKQDIDLACLEVQKQLKQADPQSPFLADVDAILSETARLIQQEPVALTDPNYGAQKRARLRVLSECATTHGEIRQHAQQVKIAAQVGDDSPEANRLQTISDQAGQDIRATPDERPAIKGRAVAAMDKVLAFAATRVAIESALDDASSKITKVGSRSPFLRELDVIRRDVAELIEEGSDELSSPNFQATKIAAIGELPACATSYKKVEDRATKSRKDIGAIWPDAPQLDEIEDLCEEAVNQMCAEPANHGQIENTMVARFDGLDRQAKRELFEDTLKTAKEKYPGSKLPRDVDNMFAYLEEYRGDKSNKKVDTILTEFALYVWKVLRKPSAVSASQGSSRSGLPTRTRNNTAGLEKGFALTRAIREASGAKNGERRLGMRALFSPGGLSTERGGRTGFYHWHLPGTAQDNMIYNLAHVVYGFTDAHIDGNHVQGRTQAKNIERRDDDRVEIGIDAGGNMFEVVDG